MQTILCLLLALFPAPRTQPPETFAGVYTFHWGACKQSTFFYPDGTCFSPQFRSGTWHKHEGTIWFTERDGKMRYTMTINLAEGAGVGNYVSSKNEFGPIVKVTQFRRGELLPMPRLAE